VALWSSKVCDYDLRASSSSAMAAVHASLARNSPRGLIADGLKTVVATESVLNVFDATLSPAVSAVLKLEGQDDITGIATSASGAITASFQQQGLMRVRLARTEQ
jgi:hypothetical protein